MDAQELNKETRASVPEGSCHYFVTRKKRYCRFKPSQGVQYCAEHAALMGAELGRKRVQCPYEPKHTCYEDKLKHHMKKCPSRPKEMPAYYSANINSGHDAGELVPEPKETILTVPVEEVKLLIDKVNQLYDEYIGSEVEEILSHECLQAELNNSTYGTAALRHRKQQASLIGHMDQLGLLKDAICYLEMGAGKGQLSHWLHGAVQKYRDNVFVLIDRSHVRNKMDNLHKEEEVMERIRIDIEHLRLDKVPTIEKHDKPVVAFGKHLCGPATDLSLRCVCETLQSKENTESGGEEEKQRKRLKTDNRRLGGAVIALCCHHRCSWRPYVGKAFFQSSGLTARDFQLISSMSSWATCAWKGWSADKKQKGKGATEAQASVDSVTTNRTDDKYSGEGLNHINVSENIEVQKSGNNDSISCIKHTDVREEKTKEEMDKNENLDNTVKKVTDEGRDGSDMNCESKLHNEVKEKGIERPSEGAQQSDTVEEEHRAEELNVDISINKQYSQEEREVIGRKCKRLIDYGRLQYLQQYGLTTSMKVYIEQFYTPENIVLLAAS